MHLDYRDRHRADRVRESHARMGEAARVDQTTVGGPRRDRQAVDECPFVIGLETLHPEPKVFPELLELPVDRPERLAPVQLGLTGAQEIHVRAVQNPYGPRHQPGPPFSLLTHISKADLFCSVFAGLKNSGAGGGFRGSSVQSVTDRGSGGCFGSITDGAATSPPGSCGTVGSPKRSSAISWKSCTWTSLAFGASASKDSIVCRPRDISPRYSSSRGG